MIYKQLIIERIEGGLTMKKKKILVGLLAGVLISVLAIGGTVAWLTDKEEVTNTFSIGNVDIKINEEYKPEDGKDIYPGKVVTKIPTVKNIGKNSAYIRVKVAIDSQIEKYLTLDYKLGTTSSEWFIENGYYYYNSIVVPNDSTKPIFTKFTLSGDFIEPKAEVSYDIIVYAEAVQSQGFEQQDGETFKKAILRAFAEYDKQK